MRTADIALEKNRMVAQHGVLRMPECNIGCQLLMLLVNSWAETWNLNASLSSPNNTFLFRRGRTGSS